MKIVLFGASGMVGQGVLRECLRAPDVEAVLSVGRGPCGVVHPRLREVRLADFADCTAIEPELRGAQACFFCLGVSSAGMAEAAYRHLTYDFALAAGRAMARAAPGSAFVYVSGAGTDSTERGRSMWARVKGATENALLALPLQGAMFRPGYIQPLHGATSRTALYRAIYAVAAPLYPLLVKLAPAAVTTTEEVGRAMLEVARRGAPRRVLEARDIVALGRAQPGAASAGSAPGTR